MSTFNIIKAGAAELEIVVPLFEEYRAFYNAEHDINGATRFLKNRIANNESVIFLANNGDQWVGFVQLYPVFSSVSMKKVFILNDLFVTEACRGCGIASALIEHTIEFARSNGCARVSLSTAKDNTAQTLYESLGFKESSFKFYNYNFDC